MVDVPAVQRPVPHPDDVVTVCAAARTTIARTEELLAQSDALRFATWLARAETLATRAEWRQLRERARQRRLGA